MKAILLSLSMVGCASTTAYYPPMERIDSKGNSHTVASKAFQTFGDSLDHTEIEVTPNGIRYVAAGGNVNSTVTNTVFHEPSQVAKWLIGWGFSYGILNSLFGHGVAAYNTNQAASVANTKTAASVVKAKPLPFVGSKIPAQTTATVIP